MFTQDQEDQQHSTTTLTKQVANGKQQPASPPSANASSLETADIRHKPDLAAQQGMETLSIIDNFQELRSPVEAVDRERYAHFDDNPLKRVAEHPVSTFSIDVDTGAYSNVRRLLNAGRLPARDAVRVEELINYFGYDYPAPADGKIPFRVTTEIAATPWNTTTQLLHIGIKGHEIRKDRLPAANLVFLIDVSGSMKTVAKLDLLKSALKLLIQQLDKHDRISIVVYAGASGVVLEPTAGDRKGKLIAALEELSAGGSTNGGAGIRLAYAMAEQAYIEAGINRIILATDGDFNVGTVSFEALLNLIEDKRKGGIALTTLGFGTGNYNDQLMEQLADAGNGNYAYIDTLNEAQKVLVDELFQDIWMKLVQARSRYRAQASFKTYLFSIAHNRVIDHYRRQLKVPKSHHRVKINDPDEFPTDARNQPERHADTQQQVDRLMRLIEALPQAQREVFLLREEVGLGVDEIARVTGVTREAAKSRLRYAMSRLRSGLRETE